MTAECGELEDWLRGRDEALACLITGRPTGVIEQHDVESIEKAIRNNFRPLTRALPLIDAFAAKVEGLRAAGVVELCPPRIYVPAPDQPTALVQDDLAAVQRGRAWREFITNSIATDVGGQAGLGRILASAALNGGLLHPSLLAALARQLDSPLLIAGEHAFFEFALPWRSQADAEFRRWFPDPITEALILKAKLINDWEIPATQRGLWNVMRGYLRGARSVKTPKSLTGFLGVCTLTWLSELPVFLVSYATREVTSHSLKRSVWRRINRCESLSESIPLETGAHRRERRWMEDGDASGFEAVLDAIFDTKSDSVRRLREMCPDASSRGIQHVFSHWAIAMLVDGSMLGNPLSISTVKAYLRQVGPALVGLGAFSDGRIIGSGLGDLYWEMLEDAATPYQRRNINRALRELHAFLVKHFSVDQTDGSLIRAAGEELAPVDANLLSEDEYKEALCYVEKSDLDIVHRDLKTVVKLLIVLGFRCGLRRSEALKLLLRDLHLIGRAELIVRPNEYRRLKTKNALRKLPLYALLSQEELTLLSGFARKRQSELCDVDQGIFLFGISELGYDLVPDETAFRIIHAALRAVTGDQSQRFYHLRHSFATWTLLRLMVPPEGLPTQMLTALPHTRRVLSEPGFQERLYGRGGPTRKHLWAITSLLGHSSTDVTLEHYLHMCDLLLWTRIEAEHRKRFAKALRGACGLPASTAYRKGAGDDWASLLNWIRARGTGLVEVLPPAKPRQAHEALTSEWDSGFGELVSNVWRFVALLGTYERSELARRFGFSDEHALAMEARAQYISANGRHRRIDSNMRPRSQEDMAVVQSVAPRLIRTLHSRPELVSSVLDHFVENAWLTRNEVVFRDPAEPSAALEFIDFLQECGFKQSEVRFIVFSRAQRSTSAAAWRRGLGKRVKIRRLVPPNELAASTKRVLGIAPDVKGIWGFRYLLTIMAVYCAGQSLAKKDS